MCRRYYRTLDGAADYWFSFEREPDGSYRAYILGQPTYGARDASLHATHRLVSNARYYVCWDRPLTTFDAACRVAAMWADATQEFT